MAATETLQDWAPVVVAAVGGLSLIVAVATLARLRKRAYEDRTYEYFRRYVDWQFAIRLSAAAGHAAWGNAKALTRVEKDEVMLAANYFDEMAAHYVRGRLDEDLVQEHFRELSEGYFQLFEWFLRDTQKRVPSAFREWKEMNRRLKAAWRPADGWENLFVRTLDAGTRTRLVSTSIEDASSAGGST
ncbi:MAG: hypothetical protein AB7I08_02760 [Thermoleophilia bacterium]